MDDIHADLFDDLQRDLSSAIRAKDKTEALRIRRALVKVRFNAGESGVDIEEDGGWMVPSADTIRAQIERIP